MSSGRRRYERVVVVRKDNENVARDKSDEVCVGDTKDLNWVVICFDRCCFYLPTLLTAGLILTEKREGIMERMMVSGEYKNVRARRRMLSLHVKKRKRKKQSRVYRERDVFSPACFIPRENARGERC